MIEISFNKYFSVFEALDIVLGPGNHLRSCGSTRAFICAKNASKHATGDDVEPFYCFGIGCDYDPSLTMIPLP